MFQNSKSIKFLLTFLCIAAASKDIHADETLSALFLEDAFQLQPDRDGDWVKGAALVNEDGLQRYEIYTKPEFFQLTPRCWCNVVYGPPSVDCTVSPGFTKSDSTKEEAEQLQTFAPKAIKEAARSSSNLIGYSGVLSVDLETLTLQPDIGNKPTLQRTSVFNEWFMVFCEAPK